MQDVSITGITINLSGTIYVSDTGTHSIRKITTDGEIITLAGGTQGYKEGDGIDAQFSSPQGLAVDSFGNVYVADEKNNRIRKVTARGRVSTLAGSGVVGNTDGIGMVARFNSPTDVAIDLVGSLYVADSGNHLIRKITSNGEVSTLAGSTQGREDGIGTVARFNCPIGVTVDLGGNVYVADKDNNLIRKITSHNNEVIVLAGLERGHRDDIRFHAQFDNPWGVAVDSFGNVYVAEVGNNRIRRIMPEGVVRTFAGSGEQGYRDGTATQAQFRGPISVAVNLSDVVYVVDGGNYCIRKITKKKVGILAGYPQLSHHTYLIADTPPPKKEKKSKLIAYILLVFLGVLGGHKFYLGKTGLGILYLLTGGLVSIGIIVDLFILGKQVDKYNRTH